jgi:large subunit ribosomal protein L32e
MSKDFKRYSSHKLKRLSPSWRKQRGLHNKVRLSHRGYIKKVKIGYGTSSELKSKIIVIKNEADLESVKTNKDSKLLFSSKLGKRKKIVLLKKAKDYGLKILNIEDDFEVKVENELKVRKAAKTELKQKKESRQKELTKKAEEKKKKEEKKTLEEKDQPEVSEKDKKDEEKKEKDKILTKKDSL